jgi:hypothetical protein
MGGAYRYAVVKTPICTNKFGDFGVIDTRILWTARYRKVKLWPGFNPLARIANNADRYRTG